MPVIHLKSGSLLVWPASRLEGCRQRARACPDWGRGPVSRPGPPSPQGHPSSPVPALQALQVLPGSPSPDPAGIAPEMWYAGGGPAARQPALRERGRASLWRVRVCIWLWPQRAPHPLARTSLEPVQAVRGSSSFWGTHGGSLGESHLPGSFARGRGAPATLPRLGRVVRGCARRGCCGSACGRPWLLAQLPGQDSRALSVCLVGSRAGLALPKCFSAAP